MEEFKSQNFVLYKFMSALGWKTLEYQLKKGYYFV